MEIRIPFFNVIGKRLALGYTHSRLVSTYIRDADQFARGVVIMMFEFPDGLSRSRGGAVV